MTEYLRRKLRAMLMSGAAKAYLRTVSGYPCTLTACIRDGLVSLTVNGAVDGVGDKSGSGYDLPVVINDKSFKIALDKPLTSRKSLNIWVNNATYVEAGKTYTFAANWTRTTGNSGANLRIYEKNSTSSTILEVPVNGWYYWGTNGSRTSKAFTPTVSGYLRLNNYGGLILSNIMVVEGSYGTAPEYEAPGADVADSVSLNIEEKTAVVIDRSAIPYVTTDISDNVDWEEIPQLQRGTATISTDTAVQPSSITAQYYAI
jgi:hypothetical protein